MDSTLLHTLDRAFNPRGIAVVGASNKPATFGYLFTRHLIAYGFPGQIYPVNPGESTVQGLTAYRNLDAIPGEVDLVICCLPATMVAGLLRECRSKGVTLVHIFTGRLSETGRANARDLEMAILGQARQLGIRLIGPNCMGLYHPRYGVAGDHDFPSEPGPVGALLQSGGTTGEFIRYGSLRGLRFSKVIGYGNALDIDESDLLSYLAQDDETAVIATYIEGVKDGQKFATALKEAAQAKPTIVLKGGKGGQAGARATSSHTASLSGTRSAWDACLKQAGAVSADTLGDMLDLVVAFRFLPAINRKRAGVVGGGGGRAVLSADECEAAGLELPPFSARTREELNRVAPGTWDWLGNPVDRSIMLADIGLDTGTVLGIMARSPDFDFFIANLTEDAPFGDEEMAKLLRKETSDFIAVSRSSGKPLAAVLGSGEFTSRDLDNWRWRLLAEQRQRLVEAGIPCYASVTRAARSISRLVDYYVRRTSSPV